MCNIIVINRGEVEIGTPQNFLDHFGFLPVIQEYHNDFIMDACLCQCDLEETFLKHEIPYKTDCGDYYVGQLDLIKGDEYGN